MLIQSGRHTNWSRVWDVLNLWETPLGSAVCCLELSKRAAIAALCGKQLRWFFQCEMMLVNARGSRVTCQISDQGMPVGKILTCGMSSTGVYATRDIANGCSRHAYWALYLICAPSRGSLGTANYGEVQMLGSLPIDWIEKCASDQLLGRNDVLFPRTSLMKVVPPRQTSS